MAPSSIVHQGTCGALTPIACNDVDWDQDPSFGSRTLATLAPGETVLIEVIQDDQFGIQGGETIVTFRESPVFQLNTSAPEDAEGHPVVAAQADGDFVVAWSEHNTTGIGGDYVIVARPYDASGAPTGPPVRIDVNGTESRRAEVAVDGAGNFIAAWGESSGARARRFDASGTPIGSDIVVSATAYEYVDVGAAADGGFVVVWQDGLTGGVSARAFDETDAPITGEIPLQAADSGWPSVAVRGDGSFVATWTDRTAADGNGDGVVAQRFDASGTALGSPFVVNTTTLGLQGDAGPAISADAAGNFVIAWEDYGSSPQALRARRFDPAGTPLGSDFQVNEPTGGDQEYPALSHDSAGRFVVAWWANYDGPVVRRFDVDGDALGPQLQAGFFEEAYTYHVDIAARTDDFVVVWESMPVNTDKFIHAHRPATDPVPFCAREPRSGCRQPTLPGKGLLSVKEKSPSTGDRVIWKWLKGEATTLAELGDPLTRTSFALCVYEPGGLASTLLLEAAVHGGGSCGGQPCWKALPTGYRYVEKKGLYGGVAKIVLAEGSDGAAKVIVKAKGRRIAEALGMPSPLGLPTSPPVTVQLVASNGTCFSATYDAGITLNTFEAFQATPD